MEEGVICALAGSLIDTQLPRAGKNYKRGLINTLTVFDSLWIARRDRRIKEQKNMDNGFAAGPSRLVTTIF